MADYDAPFEKHSIFLQSLINMRVDPIALFTGTNMYTHYTINGEEKAGYIPACEFSREPVEDLCYDYDAITYDGAMCVDFGPFKGGMGCKQNIPIRSSSDTPLTQVDIMMNVHGMNGSFLGDCGVNDSSGLFSRTCQDMSAFDFGPMGMFSRGVLFDPMVDYAPFDKHSIYVRTLASMSFDPVSLFTGENLYTNYVKEGTLVSGKIPPCKKNYADDLCYEDVEYSGFCLGVINLGCTQTVPLKNQRSNELTHVSTIHKVGSLFEFAEICGVDGDAGNCSNQTAIDMAFVGFLGKGTIFDPIPDYSAGDRHSIFEYALFSMMSFGGGSLYGTFLRNDEWFYTELEECLTPSQLVVDTGPLDAWDAYRGGPASDKQISTKIVNETFRLRIASLNDDGDQYTPKNLSTKIYYDLYENGSNTPIPGVIGGGEFDASLITEFEKDFTVADGYKDLSVGFRFCSTYSNGDHILQVESACTAGEAALECDQNSAAPKWHVCKSTDNFAVRPMSILVASPSGTDISKLRSGKTYAFDVKAAYWEGGTPRAVPSYTKTLDQDDINKTLILATDVPDTSHILSGDLNLTDATFVNGEGSADIYFTDVARVLIRLEDKEWAAVDNDDTPQSCEGGFVNGVNVPDGSYLCGAVNTTFIPDHFALKSVRLGNHDNGSFTYLGIDQDTGDTNNDIDMSAHIDMTVVAENALNQPTENFREGAEFYENPVSVTLTVPTKVVDGITMVPFKHDLNTIDLMPAIALGFGTVDDYGTYHFAWDTAETVKKLNFNYEKDPSAPIRPFSLSVTDLDFDINVTSVYGGVEISGATTNPAELSGAATFYYAKVKAARPFFDDVSESTVTTPITVQVYCPLTLATCGTVFGIDTANGRTTDNKWWLSTGHQQNSCSRLYLSFRF